MQTLEELIEKKQKEFKKLTEQLEAGKAFIEDKIADAKRVEAELILLNTALKMLRDGSPSSPTQQTLISVPAPQSRSIS